jgi:hypothetical protein
MNSKSEKLNKIIKWAETNGLDIKFEDKSTEMRDTYAVTFSVKNRTELPMFDAARGMVLIYATRANYGSKLGAFKLHCNFMTATANVFEIKPTTVVSYINSLVAFSAEKAA